MASKEKQIVEEKPKVRIIKAGQQLKSGVIRVEDPKGTLYRVPCDRCETLVTTPKPPSPDKEITCRACGPIARNGKPSTKVKRKGDKVMGYLTECDTCGDLSKTTYLPKKDRPFLCKLCFVETDEGKEQQRLKRTERTDRFEAERQAAAAAEAGGSEATAAVKKPTGPGYAHTCKNCRKKFLLGFRPDPGQRVVCPECFEKESLQEERKKERPSTRLIFKIECVVCGKAETVDFVPKSLSEPMCSDCFEKKWRK